MPARTETLYRDAPHPALVRIDEASVPDCGSAAIARLRAENGRRDRLLWYLTTALWLTLCVCVLGIATFRQAPFIVLGGFVAARDVVIVLWISRDRAGLAQKAIEEITRLQGAGRIAREARLREAVAAWNAEAADCRARREAHQLLERRRFLVAEIGELRGGGHAAA